MKNNFNYKIIVLLLLCMFARSVNAATLSSEVNVATVVVGDIIVDQIRLNTEGDVINAVEGDIVYDPNIVSVEAINIGSSFVNFWVEKPSVSSPGRIHFSGITPGGVNVASAEAFTVVFKADNVGHVKFSFENVKLLLNDGQGTLAKTKTFGSIVQINPHNSNQINTKYELTDQIHPEKFTISRSRSLTAFDNKYFIAFETSDKGSGVSKYKVCEFISCIDAVSPFVLYNQTPFYHIKVKAFDANGNEQDATITSSTLVITTLLLLFISIYVIIYLYGSKR